MRLRSQEALSQPAQWQRAAPQWCSSGVMFTANTRVSLQDMISVAVKRLTLNCTVVCGMFSLVLLCTDMTLFNKNWLLAVLLCFENWFLLPTLVKEASNIYKSVSYYPIDLYIWWVRSQGLSSTWKHIQYRHGCNAQSDIYVLTDLNLIRVPRVEGCKHWK